MERLARMERINREREESEAMVEEAAILMLEINRQHLQEFLQTNPQATYEEWIQDLHPDNVYEEGIDHRFYVHDSDHRLLWNELLDGDRTYVAAKNNSNSNSNSNMDE